MAELETTTREHLATVGEALGVAIAIECTWDSPVVDFDGRNIDSVEASAKTRDYSYRRMMSGAGHNAVNISKIRPTSMIFVPCLGGISHNEAEHSSPEQCVKGAQVLCDAVLAHADRV